MVVGSDRQWSSSRARVRGGRDARNVGIDAGRRRGGHAGFEGAAVKDVVTEHEVLGLAFPTRTR